MQFNKRPLDDDDRLTLRVFLRRERLAATLHLLSAFSAAAPAVVVGLLDAGAPLTLTVAAASVGVAAWQLSRFHARHTMLAPLRGALSAGWKYAVRGTLSGVDIAQPGHLRYRVDGRALVMRPLAAPLDLVDPTAQLHISRFEHVPATEVELHWMPLRDGQGALLRVDHPALPPPERVDVEMCGSAVERSGWQVRQLAGLLAVALAFVILMTVASYGFSASQLLQTLGIAGLTAGAVYALNRARIRRLRRDCPDMTVVRGVITEVLEGRERAGRRTRRHTWYRVGGMLISPGTALRGRVTVGSPVVLEYLASNEHGYGGQLVDFRRGATGD